MSSNAFPISLRVDNSKQLHSALGYLPPVEYEMANQSTKKCRSPVSQFSVKTLQLQGRSPEVTFECISVDATWGRCSKELLGGISRKQSAEKLIAFRRAGSKGDLENNALKSSNNVC